MAHPHYRALIVDDDQLILNTLKRHLESWSLEVLSVPTTEQARPVISAQIPDIIILDLLLSTPQASLDFLDFLQGQESWRHIPVLVLTNLDKPELRDRLLSAGKIKEYLIKGSLNLEDLHQKIWSYLEPAA